MSEPMDKQQIETMLDLHHKWLYDEPGGERANLRGANLRGALNASLAFAQTCVCPQKGAFIGFKNAYYGDFGEPCIVELEIPADAKRSNASERKCRASKARVVSITDLEGQPIDGAQRVFSGHDHDFTYSNGVIVEPRSRSRKTVGTSALLASTSSSREKRRWLGNVHSIHMVHAVHGDIRDH